MACVVVVRVASPMDTLLPRWRDVPGVAPSQMPKVVSGSLAGAITRPSIGERQARLEYRHLLTTSPRDRSEALEFNHLPNSKLFACICLDFLTGTSDPVITRSRDIGEAFDDQRLLSLRRPVFLPVHPSHALKRMSSAGCCQAT